MEIFFSFYSWETQCMLTINPVSCFASGCLICLPRNLPPALLSPRKCKNLWASATRPGSPAVHSAPKVSQLGQQQQWKILHMTRAWTSSESLVTLVTTKLRCSGLQAWPGRFCSWASPATPSPQKYDLLSAETGHDVKYSNAQWAATSSFGPFVTF